MPADSSAPSPKESRIAIGPVSLFAREVGAGPPIVVLHGIPFDHRYLLPEMDGLAESHRLVYYDQRGRGRSGEGVRPQDVSIRSDLEDLERVLDHFGLTDPVLLGHSWGGLLALEFALHRPRRISRLVLMNPAPAAAADWTQLVSEMEVRLGPDWARLGHIEATPAYQRGDWEPEAQIQRIFFRHAFAGPGPLEAFIARVRGVYDPAVAVRSRAVAERLFGETLSSPGYDLIPRLCEIRHPALVIWSDHELVPRRAIERIVQGLPNARLTTIEKCGHFPYMEQPEVLRRILAAFL
ncbi:MAG TPA: alpha/beta hydrolase [Thermoplasmata archaeon]